MYESFQQLYLGVITTRVIATEISRELNFYPYTVKMRNAR